MTDNTHLPPHPGSPASTGSPTPDSGYYPGPAPVAAPQPMLESDARMWSMFIHISAVIGVVISASFLGFVAPLVIWLIFRERSALVDHQGRQQLNLQLTGLIVGVAAVVLGAITFGIGFLLTGPAWAAYWVYSIVVSIIAGVKSNSGEYYRIRLAIPFFK
ncbi:DUF4870 domain-containing protein [Demequina sp. B12]|uniref:DUF4870 domain-containing protein n=1 Tax=Demequina sp. B12 TaxID=2992757 RepID=UPI00237B7968|nr:DUF4870 domain-containing protein [Demequina sp. B12]MDE0572842.1 DUF4870 domain-containing protein [Demequina sp. B12]